MASIDRDEFRDVMNALRDELRNGFGDLNDRLDELNGRTRTVETKVAVLEAAPPGRDQAARLTGAGAAFATLFTMVWQWLTR
jgi:hypothetical protein